MANLLTLDYKKKTKKRAVYKLIIVYIFGFTMVVALASVFLVPSYMLAESKRLTAEKNLELLKASISAKQNSEFEEILNKTTARLEALDVAEYQPYNEVIGIIVSAKPSSVEITSLFFRDTESAGVVGLHLTGLALTRDALLEFRDNLREVSVFSGINLPISVLARENNIDFSLQFEVNRKAE